MTEGVLGTSINAVDTKLVSFFSKSLDLRRKSQEKRKGVEILGKTIQVLEQKRKGFVII